MLDSASAVSRDMFGFAYSSTKAFIGISRQTKLEYPYVYMILEVVSNFYSRAKTFYIINGESLLHAVNHDAVNYRLSRKVRLYSMIHILRGEGGLFMCLPEIS